MNIGFSAPTRGEQATPEALTRLVKHGEALGFGIVTVSDHIVMPRDASSPYPYTPDGSIRFNAEVMEMLTVHAFLAASTTCTPGNRSSRGARAGTPATSP